MLVFPGSSQGHGLEGTVVQYQTGEWSTEGSYMKLYEGTETNSIWSGKDKSCFAKSRARGAQPGSPDKTPIGAAA